MFDIDSIFTACSHNRSSEDIHSMSATYSTQYLICMHARSGCAWEKELLDRLPSGGRLVHAAGSDVVEAS